MPALRHEPIDWTGPDLTTSQKETPVPNSTRAAIYAILAAVTALVVAYGLLTQDMAALWVALIKTIIDAAALLMARRHVPATIETLSAADDDAA